MATVWCQRASKRKSDKNVDVLKKARVLPAQIPELALRFGDEFKDVFTIEEMLDALRGKVQKGGAL